MEVEFEWDEHKNAHLGLLLWFIRNETFLMPRL